MKKIISLLIIFGMIASVTAIPALLDQQGILRNSLNNLVSGTYTFNVTLYNISDDAVMYTEADSLTVSNGVWNYIIGKTNTIDYSIFENDMYVVTKIDTNTLSAVNLTAVPYAFYSYKANDTNYLNGITAANFLTNAYNDLQNFTNTPGYITNSTANISIDWSDLVSVPADIADGDDDTNTNCSTTGSCDSIAYMNYGNSGNLSLSSYLLFGDNDTSFYELSDDRLRIKIGGTDYFEIQADNLGSSSSGGANIKSYSDTNNPVFQFVDDVNTGVGRSDADVLFLSAGGKRVTLTTTRLDANVLINASNMFINDTTVCTAVNGLCNQSLSVPSVNLTTNFGGEVSGTYNSIIIGNDVLDDQYYDSEADLTGLLDDNYIAIGDGITNSTGAWNLSFDQLCFPESDVCIVNGTSTWLWLRDVGDTTNRNLRVYNLYATNLIELPPNGQIYFGYTDTDKYIAYNSSSDKLEYHTDATAEHHFMGGNLETDGDIYSLGGDIYTSNIRTSSGALWLFSSTYTAIQTGAGQDVLIDFGDVLQMRDQDSGDAVRFEFDSATGNLNITGKLMMNDKNITNVDCITFNSGGQICSG